jgi:hypothetical protein
MRPRPKRTRRILGGTVVLAAVAAGMLMLNPLDKIGSAGLGRPANPTDDSTVVTTCSPNQPAFYYGFRDLQAQLGSRIGQPIECEQPIHANGDTRQRTSTGYAYYRKESNIPSFTNGWEHWALTSNGLMYWTGDVVDPPTADR